MDSQAKKPRTDRRIAAYVCLAVGLGLLIMQSLKPDSGDTQSRIAPAVAALIFSLLYWGLVTIQNIVELVALIKGRSLESAGRETPGKEGESNVSENR